METIHTGAAAITFPTTPEAFIAYQEQLAGRKLTEHEREVTAAWVEVFNLSYEGGLEQDRAALEDSLAKWTSRPPKGTTALWCVTSSGSAACGLLLPGSRAFMMQRKGA